jgi:hypothetical protein
VIVGYEQMPDPNDMDCSGGFDDGFCGTVDDLSLPIYNPPPSTETDLGEASITVNSITITAQTAAVPEPAAMVLAVLGLGGFGLRGRRSEVGGRGWGLGVGAGIWGGFGGQKACVCRSRQSQWVSEFTRGLRGPFPTCERSARIGRFCR